MMKNTVKYLTLLLMFTLLLTSCAATSYPPLTDDKNGAMIDNDYKGSQIGEEFSTDAEDGFQENPFASTATQNVSTFSADVDTASYAYFRKLVNAGYTLEDLQNNAAAFRTEEFLNYFKYSVTAPTNGALFGSKTEIVPCPWNSENLLFRLTLQAENATERVGNNLVFLIDVSGSMSEDDKLPLLKRAFTYLVGNLGANDTVSIVTYSGREEVVLDGCSGLDSARILDAIHSLRANGSTNGEAGIAEAYRIAEKHMIAGGNNRIIMASDGDLNVGVSSVEELKALIEGKRDAGVFLSIVGFGSGNYRSAKMETLADNGNGVYYYIDGESEAEKIFGTDLLGTLYTIAKDVKLQITFDTEMIESYRLIGYENRILNQEDFKDNAKDAGDVGVGHQVTVCYELKPCAQAKNATDPWMELAVRYQKVGEALYREDHYKIGAEAYSENANEDLRFQACVIRCAMLLHKSQYLPEGYTVTALLEELDALNLNDYSDRAEFRELIRRLTIYTPIQPRS